MSDECGLFHQIIPRENDGPVKLVSSLVDAPKVAPGFVSIERGWFKIATYAALVVLFLWPAIYNGQPFFYPDTGAYIRGFDAGVVWLTGKRSAWTTWASALPDPQGTSDKPSVKRTKSLQSPSFIIAGRSVSYGALLYLGELLGGLWASVVIQAAFALAAVSLTLKHFKLFTLPNLLVTAGVLGLVSSLPFFAAFLLPDVFAGLSLLAAANLLALGDRLKRWERVFWLSILTAAVIFHPSHLAIVLMLLGAAIIGRLVSAKISPVGTMALVLAAIIGLASEIGFGLIVEKVLKVQVSRPPVIMGRIIADGTGAAYLREKCPQAGFVVCKFVDRLKSNSDAFLWDRDGIYRPAQITERKALGEEQYRFAAAVLAYDPVGQITATLSDGVQQLKAMGLSDFTDGAEQAFAQLPPVYAEQMISSRLWQQDFPIASFSKLTVLVAMFSLIFIVVTLIKHWNTISASQKLFCFVIFLGQFANALICGGLSGPHERYQARLAWLIPLVALLLYYQIRETTAATRRSPSIIPAAA
jgi:hypothetical protein